MDTIEPEKNVHVNLPQALVVQMQKAVEAGDVTLDEIVRQAVQRYLSDRSWNKLYAYGEAQSRKLGIQEEDVDRIIHEYRQEERGCQNKERGRLSLNC